MCFVVSRCVLGFDGGCKVCLSLFGRCCTCLIGFVVFYGCFRRGLLDFEPTLYQGFDSFGIRPFGVRLIDVDQFDILGPSMVNLFFWFVEILSRLKNINNMFVT